ncbi:unnamed protein product, partial [Coccothraustes coccothraustes]
HCSLQPPLLPSASHCTGTFPPERSLVPASTHRAHPTLCALAPAPQIPACAGPWLGQALCAALPLPKTAFGPGTQPSSAAQKQHKDLNHTPGA